MSSNYKPTSLFKLIHAGWSEEGMYFYYSIRRRFAASEYEGIFFKKINTEHGPAFEEILIDFDTFQIVLQIIFSTILTKPIKLEKNSNSLLIPYEILKNPGFTIDQVNTELNKNQIGSFF